MAKKIETIFSIQDKYTRTMNKIINSSVSAEKKINKASYATDKFNEKMNKLKAPSSSKITKAFDNIKSKADTAKSSVNSLLRTLLSLATVKVAINAIDTTTLTNSRLKLINDGSQTDEQLRNKIMQSADDSRSTYSTTADNVAKLGLLAGDNFNSNDEVIKFSELLNKSFKIGGASTQAQEAGTYQLTQAMAAGKLQGDEYKSIIENAPLLAKSIEDYMINVKKAKGSMKDWASEGLLTADVIKNAMFQSAGDIEESFSKLPKTFGDYWNLIKNKAIRAFTPVIEKINNLINTPQFEEFFNNLAIAIQVAAEAVNWLIDGFVWLCQIMEPFVPIILGVVGALIAYKIYTALATAAQWAFNAAMTANPVGLVIAAIVALIVILTYLYFTNDKVAYAIIYLWDMLVIGAMTLWLGLKTVFYGLILVAQFFLLGMVGVAYGVLWAWYMFQTGLEAVGVGILYIFQGLYNGVLMIVNGIIDILNKIPGVKIDKAEYASFADDALSGMMENVTQRNEDLQSLLDDMTEINNSINDNKAKFAADLSQSATDIQNKVYETESTRQSRVDNRNNWMGDLQDKINGALDIGNSAASSLTNGGKDSIPVTADGGTVDSVDDVSISDEDLKYMKDFAEQEYVNKFTTATLAPNVNISFGDVHETADAEKLKGRIEEILEEELAEVAEGVYD